MMTILYNLVILLIVAILGLIVIDLYFRLFKAMLSFAKLNVKFYNFLIQEENEKRKR